MPSAQAKTMASRSVSSPGDEGPRARALHHAVDVAIDVAVEGTGRTGAERTADEGPQHEPEVGNPVLRENHHRRRRNKK
jgi:hypothetical protein